MTKGLPGRSLCSLLFRECWIDVAVLQYFFQIGPHAQIGHVIGHGRKAVWNALGDHYNVALLNLTGCESDHGPIAGWAIQDRRHFVISRGSRPIDDRSPCDERPAA